MKSEFHLPRLSVVLAYYNQSDTLPITLRSFIAQGIDPAEYELIVIDDHSVNHLARYIVGSFRKLYPNVALTYVRQNRPNGGTYGASAVAKNIGVRFACGEYVFFNNSEIVQASESMKLILETLAGSKAPLCLRGRVLDVAQQQIEKLSLSELEVLHNLTDRNCERVASGDHAGLAATSRALLIAVGGIDERFDYWGKEDLDLAARLKRAGARYIYDPNLKSFHVSHSANFVRGGDYLRMAAQLERNHGTQLIEANIGQPWGTWNTTPASELDGTVVVEAYDDPTSLSGVLENVLFGPGGETRDCIIVVSQDCSPKVRETLFRNYRNIKVVEISSDLSENPAVRVFSQVRTSVIAFLPKGCSFTEPDWSFYQSGQVITQWPLRQAGLMDDRGWLAIKDVIIKSDLKGLPANWSMTNLRNYIKEVSV